MSHVFERGLEPPATRGPSIPTWTQLNAVRDNLDTSNKILAYYDRLRWKHCSPPKWNPFAPHGSKEAHLPPPTSLTTKPPTTPQKKKKTAPTITQKKPKATPETTPQKSAKAAPRTAPKKSTEATTRTTPHKKQMIDPQTPAKRQRAEFSEAVIIDFG